MAPRIAAASAAALALLLAAAAPEHASAFLFGSVPRPNTAVSGGVASKM